MPALSKAQKYTLEIIANNKSGTSTLNTTSGNSNNVATKAEINYAQDKTPAAANSDISAQITKKSAQEIAKEGIIVRLNYTFRTSQYPTLARKLNALNFDTRQGYISTGLVFLRNSMNADEYFDEEELKGSKYTENKPLIEITALMDDPFAAKFKTLFYNDYPLKGITVNRTEAERLIGVPPVKALPILPISFI